MPLTRDELKLRDSARLEELIANMMAAKRSKDDNKIDSAMNALNEFRIDTAFMDLQDKAREAREAATHELITSALTELAAITSSLTSAGDAFSNAAQIAASGKKELLLPRLAATAAHGLEIFTELQDTITQVKTQINNVNELKDLPAAVENVQKALKNLQDKVKQA